ncbi:39S ribosomal protein L18, mitochondrial isoform X2 [Daktulosphaira vitifoliae]|uniref:39S ribosomal protein L18, mitochondrial isoform X2 n=1 Tax=Daktulosphaira vitifoliae TaxID=58002 RepID=UPI0021A9A616|nr:39S ribosomal protein L18, mitochondrial isoform X2 [Daktulosphaira vitifoliae]
MFSNTMINFRLHKVNISNFIGGSIKKCSSFIKNDSLSFSKYVYNRNPRNLEKLRIAYKPAGYHLEKPGREFWHKLEINISKRHVTASILHNSGVIPLLATTAEWAIRKQLFSTRDKVAFATVGKVLAQRCLESGIFEVLNTYEAIPGGKDFNSHRLRFIHGVI